MTARTGQPEYEDLDRITVAGQCLDRTAETSQPREVGLKSQAEQVKRDRQRGQDSQNMITKTWQLGRDIQDRTDRT
jgi:hypothetical protein